MPKKPKQEDKTPRPKKLTVENDQPFFHAGQLKIPYHPVEVMVEGYNL